MKINGTSFGILLYLAEPKSLQYFVNSAQYRVFKLDVNVVKHKKVNCSLVPKVL